MFFKILSVVPVELYVGSLFLLKNWVTFTIKANAKSITKRMNILPSLITAFESASRCVDGHSLDKLSWINSKLKMLEIEFFITVIYPRLFFSAAGISHKTCIWKKKNIMDFNPEM